MHYRFIFFPYVATTATSKFSLRITNPKRFKESLVSCGTVELSSDGIMRNVNNLIGHQKLLWKTFLCMLRPPQPSKSIFSGEDFPSQRGAFELSQFHSRPTSNGRNTFFSPFYPPIVENYSIDQTITSKIKLNMLEEERASVFFTQTFSFN